jgi:hypothetical protein
LTGIVTTPDGQPIAGAEVYLRDGGKSPKTGKTDELGAFSIAITDPPAKYVQVSKKGNSNSEANLGYGSIDELLKITLEPVEKPRDIGSVYGKVFETSGDVGYAFFILMRPLNHQANIRYAGIFSALTVILQLRICLKGMIRSMSDREDQSSIFERIHTQLKFVRGGLPAHSVSNSWNQ